MNAEKTNPSLVMLVFLLNPEFAKEIKDFQKNMISRFNLKFNPETEPDPHIPFLGAKWIEGYESETFEKLVSSWAANQLPMSVLVNRVKNIDDEVAYLQAFPEHNPYAISLTEVFYNEFKDAEKDISEPFDQLLIPVVKRMGGPKLDIQEVTNHLVTREFYTVQTINSVSILELNSETKKWVERKKFDFKEV